MFRGGDDAKIIWIIALKTGNERYSHSSREKGVLTISFLAAAPSRIAKNVDIGRPEIQSFHDVSPAGADRLVVFGSRLGADHDCHVMDQGRIKSRCQSDRLGKNGGCSSIGHAMQGLAPPVVIRDLQSRNRARLV